MNKKIAIAMTSNVALALLMTTGCHSLTAGRTAFGAEKVDPYTTDTTPVITIDEKTTTEVTPTEVVTAPIVQTPIADTEVSEKDNSTYVPPTATEVSPSYQKYVIPTGYENPTEGLKPVEKLPVRTQEEIATVQAEKQQKKPATEEGYFIYVVKPGDCLSVIANSNGVKTKELAELNGLKPDSQVRIGQKLKIPAGRKPFTSNKDKSSKSAAADGSVYVVKSGDCLSVIAQNLGVKMAELMSINNLKNANSIYVGQVLKLPSNVKAPIVKEQKPVSKPVIKKEPAKGVEPPKPIAPKADDVQADPFSLEDKVEAVPEPIIIPPAPVEANEATENADTKEAIIIPPAPIEAEEAAPQADAFDFNIDDVIMNFENANKQVATAVATDVQNLKVAEGDTLDLIAANYNTTVEDLRKLNGFDSSKKIKAGDIIMIPAQSIK